MARRYSRDANSAEIIDTFRALGWSVLSLELAPEAGCPDLLVGGVRDGRRVNVLVEIKTERGKLRAGQVEWHAAWRGEAVAVVRTVDDVLALCGQA